MMSFMLGIFFMIPMIFFCDWWVFVFFMMMLFMMMNSYWFMNYFVFMAYSFGADMLSMSMIFLSVWIVMLMMIASYKIFQENNYKVEFILVLLFLLVFLVLTFSTVNLFMFYLFFESSLIPTLFLIFGWGYQPERLGAGLYLLFYTLFASLPLLLSIFYLNKISLTLYYYLICLNCNIYIYLSLIFAFLIKMPMIFVHFWLPSAHVEAPISGSMILAGVLLKLGGYGLMRVVFFLNDYSLSMNYLWMCLSLYGSVMVGVMCLYQVDMKSLIAYSSVSHMGLVLCGIFSLNYWGLCGSLVLMIGHGLCSSGLFCLANLVYERSLSRSFMINSGLISLFPSLSFFWFVLSVNNMASPFSMNFLGEVLLLNSVMSWSVMSMLFLGLSSFLACCYSIYLYSYSQHGSVYGGMGVMDGNFLREYMLIIFHLLPLNMIFMKIDIVTLWL